MEAEINTTESITSPASLQNEKTEEETTIKDESKKEEVTDITKTEIVEKQENPKVETVISPAVSLKTEQENKLIMVEKPTKIDVLLKAAGDAPIMKKKKWAVESNKQVAYLTQFIRKYIKCEPDESLFLYVNQTFVPSPDQVLSNLFDCFGTDGKLVLHYCKSQAWG